MTYTSRLRYNNEGGFLAADPGPTSTTIEFQQAPNFATLTTGQYIPIALDAGNPLRYEIVWLVAYTAGQATGTIVRAAEDGANWPAVAHPVTTTTGTWGCDITVYEFDGATNVESVFGRTGVVTAQSGDYTYEQVGADASGAAASAQSTAESFATAAVATEASTRAAADALLLPKADNLASVADTGTSRYNLHTPVLTPCACVLTTNTAFSSNAPVLTAGTTVIDGYTVQSGDHVLLTGQTTASQNGPWVVPASGSVGTRPTSFPSGGTIGNGRTISVTAGGTVYGGTTWVLGAASSGITVDTTPQSWVQSSGTPAVSVVRASGDTTGATDALALNFLLNLRRLAGGGVVKGVAGSTYYINATLIIGSNTTLDMTGCIINEVAGSNCQMVMNYGYNNPTTTADGAANAGSATVTSSVAYTAGQSITVGGAGNGGNNPLTGNIDASSAGTSIVVDKLGTGAPNPAQLIVLSQPLSTAGAITSLPVSALKAAVGAGTITVTSGGNTQTFTASAAAVNATSITITSATPNFAYPVNSVVSLGTATCGITGAAVNVYTRDTNVKILGGTWNHGTNASGGYFGTYLLMLYFIDGLVVDIEGATSGAVGGNVVQTGACTNLDLRAVGLNCRGGIENDGPTYNAHVRLVQGTTGDDSLTFLCANGHSGSPFPTSGDITNVSVGTVQTYSGLTSNKTNSFKVIAGAGNTADNIKVYGSIQGQAWANGAWIGDDPSGQLQMIGGYYGDIDLGLISTAPGLGGAGYSQLILYNVNGKHIKAALSYPPSGTANIVGCQTKATSSTVTSTLEHLELSGDFDVSGGTNIQTGLYINNVYQTITKATLRDFNFTGNSGSGTSVVGFNTASTVTEIDWVNVRVNALTANANYGVKLLAGSTVTRFNVIGGSTSGLGTLIDDSLTAAITVTLSGGFNFNNGGVVWRIRSTGTKTLMFAGCQLDTVTTGVLYASAASTLIVYGNPLFSSITSWLTNSGGGTVEFVDCSHIPIDVANLTQTAGDEAYNTNAASGPLGFVRSNGTIWRGVTRAVTTTNAPGATPSINSNVTDVANLTGVATAITSMTTNLTGSPVAGQPLTIKFTDAGTGEAITWGAKFVASTVSLPTTTVSSTLLTCYFEYDTVAAAFRLMWKA